MSYTKYVMTPSHPEYRNRDINISAYCEVVGCTFNKFNERVFNVAWYSSEEFVVEGRLKGKISSIWGN